MSEVGEVHHIFTTVKYTAALIVRSSASVGGEGGSSCGGGW